MSSSHDAREGTIQPTIQQRGVYFAGQDCRCEEPAFYVPIEVARRWTAEKKAYSVNHGRDITLAPDAQQLLFGATAPQEAIQPLEREQSCIMGERVMNANVEAETWARRMVRSWNPAVARAEHLRSLRRYQEQKSQLEPHY